MEERKGIVTGQRIKEEKLRRAKELRRQQTPEEDLLWQRLRRSQLNGWHFRRQQVIDGFIADFYCHRAGLIVEVDGGSHHGRADYDAERDGLLRRRQLSVLRVRAVDVRQDLTEVLK